MGTKMMFNVIKRADKDSKPEVIEIVERIGAPVFAKYGKEWCRQWGVYRVSYKGKLYHSFVLPRCYGEAAGQCIDISQ